MTDTLKGKEATPEQLPVVAEPVHLPTNIEPMMEMEKAVDLFENIQKFCLEKLVEGKEGTGDYSVIPGTGKKPSLLQSGAEKLAIWFGLISEFENKRDIIDTPDGQIISIDSTCRLRSLKTGNVVAIFGANCNTGENKYANNYEWIPQWEMPDGIDKSGLETKTVPTKSGGSFKKYKVEKPLNPWDKYNTVLKMAEKRSFVGATKIATGTSGMFTQDLEDMSSNGYRKQQPKQTSSKQKPQDKAKPTGGSLTSKQAEVLNKLAKDCLDAGQFTQAEYDTYVKGIPKMTSDKAGEEIQAMQNLINGEN